MAALEMSLQPHHIDDINEDSYFSDMEERSSYYHLYSTMCGSYDGYSFNGGSDHDTVINCVIEGPRGASSVSDCTVKCGVEIVNAAHLVERVCRICHLGLESNGDGSSLPMLLGCSCKDDLSAAHKLCAEAWFKIKGNKTCEICQSVARNIVGPNDVEATEQPINTNSATTTAAAPVIVAASAPSSETQNFWQCHRLLNFLLAFMVIAFVISWLLHFTLPSS